MYPWSLKGNVILSHRTTLSHLQIQYWTGAIIPYRCLLMSSPSAPFRGSVIITSKIVIFYIVFSTTHAKSIGWHLQCARGQARCSDTGLHSLTGLTEHLQALCCALCEPAQLRVMYNGRQWQHRALRTSLGQQPSPEAQERFTTEFSVHLRFFWKWMGWRNNHLA